MYNINLKHANLLLFILFYYNYYYFTKSIHIHRYFSLNIFGTYVLTQPGQNSHKSPNLATLLTATLRVIRGFS